MRFFLVAVLAFSASKAYAACPAAPVGTPNDPVLQLRLNGDGKAGNGPANYFDATEEGAVVWDDANNAVTYCDGTNWVTLDGGGGPVAAAGANTQVQFNDSGALGASSSFLYSSSSGLTVTSDVINYSIPAIRGRIATGGNGVGVHGLNQGTNGIGVFGEIKSTSATGSTSSGVRGDNYSDNTYATGVKGYAWSNTGQVYGVEGRVFSPTGTAVVGVAQIATGSAKGVSGQTGAQSGIGVEGKASGTGTGTSYGVYGSSQRDSGVGVYGTVNSSGNGSPAGVRGSASSTGSNISYGVQGYSATSQGQGVQGYATHGAGQNYGVYGTTNSPNGYGVFAQGNAATSTALGIGTGNIELSDSYISNDGDSEGISLDNSGNVSIGGAAPTSKLDVQGSILSRVNNEGSATSIDFGLGNVSYTSASCGAVTLSNVEDGGSYTLVVKGTTSGTCSFSHTGLTFKYPPSHGATEAGKQTVYSFIRAGSDVYVTWIKGY